MLSHLRSYCKVPAIDAAPRVTDVFLLLDQLFTDLDVAARRPVYAHTGDAADAGLLWKTRFELHHVALLVR